VRNNLKREETSLHWHGVLVPNVEDGVPLLTTPRIGPGQSRVFEFPIKHAGTYWYHSHTGLQEQRGVYGGIVIAPRETNSLRADREEVMKTLMRGSDWYAIRKGTAQSVLGAARAGHLKDFFQREWSRLPPMDVSDVAYDAFLINGQRQVMLTGKPGETLRLRVINAGASTYFYLESSAGPLTIVAKRTTCW
jgi:FtsP/CotA-like multicopper oxidase with cupredoxin domain